MLYDINTGKAIDTPLWAKKELDDKYPDFKKKGLTIVSTPERITTIQIVPFNQPEATPTRKVKVPEGNSRKARGAYIYGDDVLNIQYSTIPPKGNASGIPTFSYPGNMVTLEHGFKVMPQNYALLFYLEYLCPNVKGNKCQNPSSRPFWQFEQLEADASAKIRRAKEEKDLENLVYFEASEDKINAAIRGLNLKAKNTLDMNRVYLLEKIKTGNELFKTNAMAILKEEVKEASGPVESESELLNRMLESGHIKFEEGKWYRKDKRGDGQKWLQKPFYEDTEMVLETAFFNLVTHLKENKKMIEDLKK